LTTRDTVLSETPARAATSRIVGRARVLSAVAAAAIGAVDNVVISMRSIPENSP
jgi:hypothetical protein